MLIHDDEYDFNEELHWLKNKYELSDFNKLLLFGRFEINDLVKIANLANKVEKYVKK